MQENTEEKVPRTPEEKAILRALRITNCGQVFHRPDPATGAWYDVNAACKYWRECDYCLGKRAEEFIARFCRCQAQVEDWLRIVQCDRKTGDKIVRRLRRADSSYWRIPTRDGSVIIFDAFHCQELIGNLEAEDLDWKDLANTPPRTRYSGRLGKEEKTEKVEENTILLKIPSIRIREEEGFEADDAYVESVFLTSHLTPEFDEEKLQAAIYERADAFIEFCEEQGVEVIMSEPINQRLSFNSFLGWERENCRVVEMVERIKKADPEPKNDIDDLLNSIGKGMDAVPQAKNHVPVGIQAERDLFEF